MRRSRAEPARPQIGRGQRGRVKHEAVGARVERRRRLEAADEGAVAELRLGVRADDSQRQSVGQELRLLLCICLGQQRRDEHLFLLLWWCLMEEEEERERGKERGRKKNPV